MAVWKKSNMFSIGNDGYNLFPDTKCEVLIDDLRIVVSYFENGKGVSYVGKNNNDGHFFLECKENDGEGSLHKFPDGNILVGSWREGGLEGFWKIELQK